MSGSKEPDWLRELEEEVAREKGVSAETLRRLLAAVDQHNEGNHPFGLSDDLLRILQDDLNEKSQI